MGQIGSFNTLIQKSIIDNWDRDALTDFKGQTLQFHDVARKTASGRVTAVHVFKSTGSSQTALSKCLHPHGLPPTAAGGVGPRLLANPC